MNLFVDDCHRRLSAAPDSDSDCSSLNGSKDDQPLHHPQGCLSICSNDEQLNGKMTNHIYLYLSKIFDHQPLTTNDICFLTPEAFTYLSGVLRRKFRSSPDLTAFELIKPRRRNEEQFKFVIKKGIRRLFKNFKKSRNGFIKGDKLLDELEFYRCYFSEVALAGGIQLESFFLPGSKIQKERSSPEVKLDKTVTFTYLTRVFRSEPFRRDFVSYLLSGFGEEYVQNRSQKLLKVAVNFEAGKRPKSNKLPWTRCEMVEAQTSFLNLIYSMGI